MFDLFRQFIKLVRQYDVQVKLFGSVILNEYYLLVFVVKRFLQSRRCRCLNDFDDFLRQEILGLWWEQVQWFCYFLLLWIVVGVFFYFYFLV